jgi:predicted NUDIX family NTP pyrophosphohydrolase
MVKIQLKQQSGNFRKRQDFPVEGDFIALTPLKQRGGKVVYAWLVEGNGDAESIKVTRSQ